MCCVCVCVVLCFVVFFFQAEDGIRDLVRSRGLGDVYKRQGLEGLPRRQEGEQLEGKGIQTCAPDTVAAREPVVALSLIHI